MLTLTLSMPAPLVAGVAAGVVLDERDRERLRTGGHVVWLRPPSPTLVRRLGRATHRPFLDQDPAAALSAMAAEREPLFEQVAHQVVDTGRTTPAEVARLVVAAVRDSSGEDHQHDRGRHLDERPEDVAGDAAEAADGVRDEAPGDDQPGERRPGPAGADGSAAAASARRPPRRARPTRAPGPCRPRAPPGRPARQPARRGCRRR